MKKREVTDEMVARFRRLEGWATCHLTDERIRVAIDAILNPPEEPEVVVTPEMKDAGFKAYIAEGGVVDTRKALADAYRAMRRLEPVSKGAYAPEEWTWCPECKCSYGPNSAHMASIGPGHDRHSRTGPMDRRVARGVRTGEPHKFTRIRDYGRRSTDRE